MIASRRILTAGFGLLAACALAVVLAGCGSDGGKGLSPSAKGLPNSIKTIMAKPRYAHAHSTWSLLAVDTATGKVLYSLNPDELAFTGSARKLFSNAAAYRTVGANGRQRTRVFKTGHLDAGGVLRGNLILQAGGDLAFGGRRINADTIQYTDFDHNDANNLGGTALLTPQDPLYALNQLAREVRASGIKKVSGDVAIDDRLFVPYRVPNQNLLISPMMINENMVDVTVDPTNVGRPAKVFSRPVTSAFRVRGSVRTGPRGSAQAVTLSGDGHIQCLGNPGCSGTLGGTIPLGFRAGFTGAKTFVGTFRVERPDIYARTAFIDALRRNGVRVRAPTLSDNPRRLLSANRSYPGSAMVAEHVSAPYSQTSRLTFKVSLNLGANLSLSLAGLKLGARTIKGALAAERRLLIKDFGVDGSQFNFPTNGSGSPDSQASPRAFVQLLRAVSRMSFSRPFEAGLPVMGVSGSLASTGRNLPGRGHVFAKPGSTLVGGADGKLQLKAQNLAGYIQARSGRKIAYALMVNNAGAIDPAKVDEGIGEVFADEGAISSILYEMG